LSPDALGLGLRVPHYRRLTEGDVAVDYFEIISENFLPFAEAPTRVLHRVRERHPVVMHGVGLNLLGASPLDRGYLRKLRRLADDLDAPFVTDHLCWTASEGRSHHDLLPVPFVDELVALAADRARIVQDVLERPFGLENLSSYVTFAGSTMTEWEFVARVAEQARCGLLLDINNVYVSSRNHGFDPQTYLSAIDPARVLQVHVAGHVHDATGVLIDTHDQPVCEEVWALYRSAWQRLGPFPTLLEWDDRIPPLDEAVAELCRAAQVRA
jgi:uncharacterized protein (UPF0276 family)